MTKSRRRGKKQRTHVEEAILEEISQRTDELGEVQAELRHYRNLWSDVKDKKSPSDCEQGISSKVYATKALSATVASKEYATKALNTLQALETKCTFIEKSLKTCLSRLNELEQYIRRQNLLIHGLSDVPMDCYDFKFMVYIADKLNAILPPLAFGKITPDDINDAHPLPTKDDSKFPAVIVQFNKRWIRNEIWKMKNTLKRTKCLFY